MPSLCKHNLNEDNNNRHAIKEGRKPMGSQSHIENDRQLRNAESVRKVSGKSTPTGYSIPNDPH